MEVMTLKGVHIFKQDKHSSEKSFITWSEGNTPPSAVLEESKGNSDEKFQGILRINIRSGFETQF